ncbi:Spermidine synthase [Corynebacterium kalinowskii]|uniref:Polyamine aminopropyltransferase n=1 Tax=Corynebacterium kalinowskii TaxID=2675216 RepID=A0A6B8W0J7_9CORY|nr:polyamine aminopropyltransferase [Corynebacterium kalinowskii]QGU01248.1 Spermidine synthase [Corynebacterium kalinowskii]
MFDLGSRWWRFFLLISVGVCAASGLIYELALLTLSTSLNGGGVVETSLIVAGYVAALGVGALCAKPLLRWPGLSFLIVESVLGLIGGVSALVLYIVFATLGQSVVVLVIATFLIGALVGMELPLLMTLIQQGKLADARSVGSLLATLNFADYLGALIGGLLWPFVLLPSLGMMRGTLAAGMINLVAALFIAVVLLRSSLPARQLWSAVCALVVALVLLVVLLVRSDGIVATARAALYRDPVIYAHQSDYQDIVITRRGKDRRLYLNGGLQYSSRDEYRYTESLVYPALTPDTKNVLVIGGGDGLAARELLRFGATVTQVELDPAVVEVANTVLIDDNGGALMDPRVTVINDDAFTWLRAGGTGASYDAIIIDLPDPDNPTLARLYSEEFYALTLGVLNPGGRMVVQASSAYTTPDVFWRVRSTVLAAGCSNAIPYHTHVPTFGDWGFVSCASTLDMPDVSGLRYLTPEVLAASAVFGLDNGPRDLEPSTLDRPFIVEDLRRGYRQAGE